MKKLAKIFLALLGIGAVALMSIRGALTRPIIFPAPKFRLNPELPGGHMVTASAERTAYGYYAKAGKRLVVFFHGNGEVMGSMQGLAAHMLKQGLSVLMIEYPGYGFASAYKTSEANIYEDSALLLKLMREKFSHAAADTVLWGFSIGSGVAVEMAKRKLGDKIILMAPFTSVADAAEHHTFFGARWLIVDDFNNKAKASQINCPALVVHGERDSIIPFRMGEELARLIWGAKFIAVAGADHNDLFEHLTAAHWQTIRDFAPQ